MDETIIGDQRVTQALDVLSGMKNALGDVIERLLTAHLAMDNDQIDDKSAISEILIQAYAFRTHVLSLIQQYEQDGAEDYLSEEDIGLVGLIIEFCVEINDYDF